MSQYAEHAITVVMFFNTLMLSLMHSIVRLVLVVMYIFIFSQMDQGQDLLLAALSESGICPNDVFDIESQDVAQTPSTQQVRCL